MSKNRPCNYQVAARMTWPESQTTSIFGFCGCCSRLIGLGRARAPVCKARRAGHAGLWLGPGSSAGPGCQGADHDSHLRCDLVTAGILYTGWAPLVRRRFTQTAKSYRLGEMMRRDPWRACQPVTLYQSLRTCIAVDLRAPDRHTRVFESFKR